MKYNLSPTLNNSRQYSLAVAQAMPEKEYSYKPAEELMNFGELVNHIAYGIEWWDANYIRGVKTEWAPPVNGHSKDEVIANLEKAYGKMEKSITGAGLNENAVNGFYSALDHITHHRGQATTYLRCRGINPPEYIY